LRGSRNKLSEEVVCALLRDFREHGQKGIAQVRRRHPAAYLKILALLVPKEMKLEHTNRLASLTDEQLDEAIEEMLARRSGESAKVIEGEAEEVSALPAPARPTKAS
jgi:hypothetical protein